MVLLTSLLGFDLDTVAERAHAFVVVSSDLQHVVLPRDEFLYEVVALRLIGDVLHRPRAVVVAVKSVADDVAQDLPVPMLFQRRLPLGDDL